MEALLSDYPVVTEIPVAWGEMDALNHVQRNLPSCLANKVAQGLSLNLTFKISKTHFLFFGGGGTYRVSAPSVSRVSAPSPRWVSAPSASRVSAHSPYRIDAIILCD